MRAVPPAVTGDATVPSLGSLVLLCCPQWSNWLHRLSAVAASDETAAGCSAAEKWHPAALSLGQCRLLHMRILHARGNGLSDWRLAAFMHAARDQQADDAFLIDCESPDEPHNPMQNSFSSRARLFPLTPRTSDRADSFRHASRAVGSAQHRCPLQRPRFVPGWSALIGSRCS